MRRFTLITIILLLVALVVAGILQALAFLSDAPPPPGSLGSRRAGKMVA